MSNNKQNRVYYNENIKSSKNQAKNRLYDYEFSSEFDNIDQLELQKDEIRKATDNSQKKKKNKLNK